jgi:phosphate transport system protein
MMRAIWRVAKPSGLLKDALEETYGMLEREKAMFAAACDALFSGKTPEVDVSEEDKDINLSERMVRRLVFQHLTVNPEQDLPASLTLIGMVHDIERIGDYTKNMLELAKMKVQDPGEGKYVDICREMRERIDPLLEMTLKAFRESDAELARDVMRQHVEVKQLSDGIIEQAMGDPDVHGDAVRFSVASRFFRRISAHLSNIASSIANPFDKLGGNE